MVELVLSTLLHLSVDITNRYKTGYIKLAHATQEVVEVKVITNVIVTAVVTAMWNGGWITVTNGESLPIPWVSPPAPPPPDGWYVSTSGSDTNNGSYTSPFGTIQHAVSVAQPGETINISPGLYGGFNTVRSGTADRRITIRGNPTATITGRCPQTLDNVNIEGHSFITIANLVSTNSARHGFRAVNGTGIIFTNCVSAHAAHTGLLTSKATGVQVLDSVFHHAGVEHGIYLSQTSSTNDNVVIRRCVSYRNRGNGIQLNGSTSSNAVDNWIEYGVIEGCHVYSNDVKGLSLLGVKMIVISNNVIEWNRRGGTGAAEVHFSSQNCALGICGNYSWYNLVTNNTIRAEGAPSGMPCVRFSDGTFPVGTTSNRVEGNILVRASGLHVVDDVGGNIVTNNTLLTN